MTYFRKPPQMSTRPGTFVIRPDPPDAPVTRDDLLALAAQLGLTPNGWVEVTVVGNELQLTLTPLGQQAMAARTR